MMIKNSWYVVASPDELDDGKIVARTVLDTPLAIYRFKNGQAMVAYDRCPHRFAPMSLGKIIDESIQCGYHGARFDSEGNCIKIPGQESLPERCALRLFPTQEKYGFIWAWFGEGEPSVDIPEEFHVGDSPDYEGGNGMFESMQANYMLVNDNLFDITHGDYVHPSNLGGTDQLLYRQIESGNEFINGKMRYEAGDRRITVRFLSRDRTESGSALRGMLSLGLNQPDYAGALDEEMQIDWIAPSFIVFKMTVNPSDNREARFSGINLHAITPEFDNTSHYFFRSIRNFMMDSEHTAGFVEQFKGIFTEDIEVFEGQQRVIGQEKDLFEQQPVSFAGDVVQYQARNILKRMARSESS